MSAADGENAAAKELKGGHAPAVKVGGMRVVQHKKESDKGDTSAVMTPEEQLEYGSSPPKDGTTVVSGAVVKEEESKKGDKDFTAQAVKSFHDKPQPTHDVKPRQPQNSPHINQPR